ncbi:MAG: BlaI/MecI/CopY family transcriptional regulator [Cyanobacteriota bacterium]|nr:BlaI/MecI/CopY family transcriptional regulator [Cyanobacteriota bacterium]
MAPLPRHRPHQLSLGPLEREILEIIWAQGGATVKEIHDSILADPDRDLSQASVTTVLHRLVKKGWLQRQPRGKGEEGRARSVYRWQPRVSQDEARVLAAHDQLKQFLALGQPDLVASFADSLDRADLEQLEEIAARLRHLRQTQTSPQTSQED